MKYSKVVAIMSITDYALVSTSIQKLDVPGITVSMVKGFGDYINEFNNFGFSDSMKIEVYTSDQHAEKIAETLSTLANEMTEGGGVIAIEPVNKLFNLKKLTCQ